MLRKPVHLKNVFFLVYRPRDVGGYLMPTIQFYGQRRIAGAEIVICHPPICRHIGLLPLAGILPPKLLYKVNCLSIL